MHYIIQYNYMLYYHVLYCSILYYLIFRRAALPILPAPIGRGARVRDWKTSMAPPNKNSDTNTQAPTSNGFPSGIIR